MCLSLCKMLLASLQIPLQNNHPHRYTEKSSMIFINAKPNWSNSNENLAARIIQCCVLWPTKIVTLPRS
jgi:hypothetical protein